ncbi:SIR2 family protein [Helcococcus bovis]|uniref:SIR2 family protein n=1 Tax=Helcococcus bovis TaxID=3153252 RepID=UPI0038BDF223
MNLHGIEIPNKIIDALRDDKLVIFAGAGVSVDAPTNLPSFNNLVAFFSKGRFKNFITYDDSFNQNDQYLGKIENENALVHTSVADMFSRDDLQFNNWHKALVDLFGRRKKIKIVTTNYDKMFEKVCEEKGLNVNVYSNPALPYGDDFSGIVHIHGIVDDPKNIVITDKDFGKVYMYHSNVTKFLSDLFNSEYVVLFVGYSYNDLIMRYFTRAIPDLDESKRFIFIEESLVGTVSSLGVTPILHKDGDYETVYKAISKIIEFINRDAFSWESRITEISSSNPSFLDLQTDEELKHILNDIHLMDKFLKNVNNLGWLIYFNYKGYLSNLFKNEEFTDFDYIFGKWILRNFMGKDFDEFKYLCVKNNFKLNLHFQKMIIDEFENISEDKIEQLLSFTKLEKMDISIIEKIAERLSKTKLEYYKLKVFKNLIKFNYDYRKLSNFLEIDGGNKQIEINATTFAGKNTILKYWKLFSDFSDEYLIDLLYFMTNQIVNLYNKKPLGSIDLTFSIFDVFKNEDVNTEIDAYINVMKQIATKLKDICELNIWIKRYEKSYITILRRMSSYAYILRNKEDLFSLFDDSRKLYDWEKEEIAYLIKKFNPNGDHEYLSKYENNTRGIRNITKIDLESNIAENIKYILNYEGTNKSRMSILKDISEISIKNYDFAMNVIDVLISEDKLNSDIWDYLIKGLSENENVLTKLDDVLKKFDDAKILKEQTYILSLFVKRIIEKNDFEKYKDKIYILVEFLIKLIQNAKNYNPNKLLAWSDITFNSSYGVIAHCYIRITQKNYEFNLNNEEVKLFMEKNILSLLNNIEAKDSKFVIIGNLSILYTIDKDWTCENLVDIFSSKNSMEFEIAWKGFLTFSRIYPEISILMDENFQSAIRRISELKDLKYYREFVKSYSKHMLNITDNPLDNYIPNIFLLKKDDVTVFYNVLVNYLRENSEENKLIMWEVWIREFIFNRLNNLPTKLKSDELEFIIQILINISDKSDAYQLFNTLPKYEKQKFDFILDMDLYDYVKSYPKSMNYLITFITDVFVIQKKKTPDRRVLDKVKEISLMYEKLDLQDNFVYNSKILGI